MRDPSRRPLGPAAAVLLAGALLAGCGGPAPGPSPPPGTSPTASTGPSAGASPSDTAPGTRALPIYYAGPTPAGVRLYREFHPVPVDVGGDPGSSAVRELLARPGGNDPDYRSCWPPGWALRSPVAHADGVITVDLTAPAGDAGPDAARAALAVQQLVYTVQGALAGTDPVRILLAGRPVESLWGLVGTAAPISRADPYRTRSLVQIDSPGYGARVGRTVRVAGEAAAFEATVRWQVLRGDAVVRAGFATSAEGQRFSPFAFTVALEPGEYTLRVAEDDASDGEGRPPLSDTKTITVR